MPDPVTGLIVGIVAGVVFGLYGYFTKSDPGENLNYKKLVRTVVIYGAAGLLVAYQGKAITEGNIAAATATTAILGKVVDDLYARLTRELRQAQNQS